MKILFLLLCSFGIQLEAARADAGSPTRFLEAKPMSKKALASKCVPIEMGDSKLDCVSCQVKGIEDLGDVGGEHLAIAQYEFFWAPKTGLKNCGYGTVLLKHLSGSSKLQPIWGGLSGVSPAEAGKPTILKNQIGPIVQIPIRAQGTGALQFDGFLLWREGRFHEINTEAFQADLKSRLPTGLNINKGLYPNLETMTVESDVWKKDDTNCCATGGKVRATLEIKDDKLIVKSFAHEGQITK
jgi:hypothetical protein